MKKINYLLIGIFLSISGIQAQNNTPTAVLDAFNELLPDVVSPFWECQEDVFVAMFSHQDGLKKVYFNQDGQWLETRTRLVTPALPKGVRQFVEQLYATTLITYIGEVEQPTRTLYRVETESMHAVSIKLLNEGGDILEEDNIELSLVPK